MGVKPAYTKKRAIRKMPNTIRDWQVAKKGSNDGWGQ